MRKLSLLTAGLSAAALLCGCTQQEEATAPSGEQSPPATAAPAAAPATALVALAPTRNHKASGTLNLEFEGGILQVTGQVSGLAPDSDHGFHVHETGDCKAPDAASAGEHFNPTTQPHGSPDASAHHVGDMLNIHADGTGNARVAARLSGMTLKDGGPNDVLGRAVIVHERPDDYSTQPSGDSGARIACGVIG